MKLEARWEASAAALLVFSLLLACAPAPLATPPGQPASPATETQVAAPPSTKPLAPAATPKVAAEEPRYGGILTTATTADPISMDVVQETGYVVVNVLQCAYNGIIQFNPNNPEEVIGDLAKSWEVSKDGLTYTFHLHENVKFHDGTPFTSGDIKLSFDRQIDPPRGIRAPRRPELEAVDRLEAPNRDTVEFILKYPFSPILSVLSSGYQVIYSKSFVEKKGDMRKDVVGTGPYKFKGYAPGVSLEVIKNPDYFVKGRPYLDGITIYIIKDDATRLSAFRTGRVKLTGPGRAGLMPTDAEIVRKQMPQAVIISYPGLQNGQVVLNTQQKPWSDIRVRRALHLAIDRQNAIKVLAQGYGEIGSYFPGVWGIPKDELSKMPGWRQPKDADITEAKRLLAEAGYPDGFTTKALVRSDSINPEIAVYMADQLAKVGIKVELDVKEVAVRTALLNEGAFSFHPFYSSYIYPDPQNAVRHWTRPLRGDWGQNWQRSDDEKIWELFDTQSRALDPAERMKIVRELDVAIIEFAARPVIYWRDSMLAMWPEVKNRGKLIGDYSFQKYQDVWLAK